MGGAIFLAPFPGMHIRAKRDRTMPFSRVLNKGPVRLTSISNLGTVIEDFGGDLSSWDRRKWDWKVGIGRRVCDCVWVYVFQGEGGRDWILVFSQISWSPNMQCDSIWRCSFWAMIRLRWGHNDGIFNMGFVPLWEVEERDFSFSPCLHTEERLCEDKVRMWPWQSASKVVSFHQNSVMLVPWSGLSVSGTVKK